MDRYDFDRVKMTANIPEQFHKGEVFLPAYKGEKIRFVDGISDVLAPIMITWALKVAGDLYVPCKEVPKEVPAAQANAMGEPGLAAELPPPPPGVEEGKEGETGGAEDVAEKEDYPGQSLDIENVSDFGADDAAALVKEAESIEVLDAYAAQEGSLKRPRKTVLHAIENKREELEETGE